MMAEEVKLYLCTS